MVTTLTVLTFTEGSAFAESTGFRRGMDGTASTDLGASARAVCLEGIALDHAHRLGGNAQPALGVRQNRSLRRKQFDAQVGRAASRCR